MPSAVKALFFDVFGTLVDWRTCVAREAETILKPLGYTLDCFDFADRWRAEYQGAMEEVRSGRIAFCKLDVLHRRNLEKVFSDLEVSRPDDGVLRNLNLAWHRLDAWPDVTDGLGRLKRRYLVAPVSNGNISLMVDLARRNGFVWDAILGAEIARDYKPQPRAYLAAAEAFDFAPQECMMVAAHSYDLKAAAALGFATAHIARPNEAGPGKGEQGPDTKVVTVDIAAKDLGDLATQLGA
jgi:2-haloacid dehalogenase